MQTLNKPRMLSQARFFELPLCEKYPNTEFFSGAYFPVFSPNTGKYGPGKTPYLDTFHAVFENVYSMGY